MAGQERGCLGRVANLDHQAGRRASPRARRPACYIGARTAPVAARNVALHTAGCISRLRRRGWHRLWAWYGSGRGASAAWSRGVTRGDPGRRRPAHGPSRAVDRSTPRHPVVGRGCQQSDIPERRSTPDSHGDNSRSTGRESLGRLAAGPTTCGFCRSRELARSGRLGPGGEGARTSRRLSNAPCAPSRKDDR